MGISSLIIFRIIILRNIWSCNHAFIGLMYIIAGSLGSSIGTAFSFLMRTELSIPGYVIVQDNLHDYNVWITAHGVLMVFFMVMPILIGGMGNIIVPVELAAPDMVFPRLNNVSFSDVYVNRKWLWWGLNTLCSFIGFDWSSRYFCRSSNRFCSLCWFIISSRCY